MRLSLSLARARALSLSLSLSLSLCATIYLCMSICNQQEPEYSYMCGGVGGGSGGLGRWVGG
jgi:hypothetical protein